MSLYLDIFRCARPTSLAGMDIDQSPSCTREKENPLAGSGLGEAVFSFAGFLPPSELKAFYLNSSLRPSASAGPKLPPTHASISACFLSPSTRAVLSRESSLSWLLAGSSEVCSGRDTGLCWIPSSRSCLQPRMKSQFHGRK